MKNARHTSSLLQLGVVTGIALASTVPSFGQNAPAAKPAGWEKSAAAGLTLTRGNSSTLLFTANVLGSRKWDQNEVELGADATYGENRGVKNAETLHGFGQYNRLFDARTFGYARIDGLHDGVAKVDYRVTISPGVGRYFIKEPNTLLRGEVGPSLVYEKQGPKTTTYMALRLAERFEHKFNDKTKLWQSLEILPQVDKFENYIVNAELGVETTLTEKLSLRTYVQDTFDNRPAPGRKKNDVKLVTALAYKF